MIKFSFDTEQYDFRGLAKVALGVEDLSRLHETELPAELSEPRIQEQWFLKMLYDRSGKTLHSMYLKLMNEVLMESIGPFDAIQPRVCFRVQIPRANNHEPTFHRDRDWGQHPAAVNLWVPYTDVWGSNSLWVESNLGMEDHCPIDLHYGEALVFNGGSISHGQVTNETGFTRVSGDLRFIPNTPIPQ